ncbi:hypothetical protein RJ55_02618 [Drechmeria coniospora]|nr:hypothetical protein RJ55_02618 [Drechmeria coniospora]
MQLVPSAPFWTTGRHRSLGPAASSRPLPISRRRPGHGTEQGRVSRRRRFILVDAVAHLVGIDGWHRLRTRRGADASAGAMPTAGVRCARRRRVGRREAEAEVRSVALACTSSERCRMRAGRAPRRIPSRGES